MQKKKNFSQPSIYASYTNTQTHHLGGGGENAFFKEFKV